MSAPLLSVMVVTYNHGLYVAQALDGILMQQVDFEYEIVIADDASTDNTVAVCKQYQLQYPDIIKIIANTTNKGLLDNYFDTLLSCQGDYIADCSGDDYWIDPFKLHKQMDILLSHPEVTMVHTNWKLHYQQEGTVVNDAKTIWAGDKSRMLEYNEHGWRATLGFSYCPAVFTSSSCFRKADFTLFYDQHQELFRDQRYPCEDIQLTFAMLHQGKLWYIDEDTSVYRILPHSTLHSTDSNRHFKIEAGALDLKLTIVKEFKLPIAVLDDYLKAEFNKLFRLSIHCQNWASAQQLEQLRLQHHIAHRGANRLLWLICRHPLLFVIAGKLKRVWCRINHIPTP